MVIQTRSQAVARLADNTALITADCIVIIATVAIPFPAVDEVLGTKRNLVTSLTFRGHVTSSIT